MSVQRRTLGNLNNYPCEGEKNRLEVKGKVSEGKEGFVMFHVLRLTVLNGAIVKHFDLVMIKLLN